MDMDSVVIRNGIKVLADKCQCGENLRLHTYIFGMNAGQPEAKFYTDCPKCGFVTDWFDSPDKCLA